jgi:ubiquinol-cytochrome c reductase iron-sulfur subunit
MTDRHDDNNRTAEPGFLSGLKGKPEHRDPQRRRILIATSVVGGCGIVASVYPFLASMEPSERAKALGAPVEVDLANLRPGELFTVAWRGRPVWVLKRTPEMIAAIERATPFLVDPASVRSEQPKNCRNQFRSIKPEVAVMVGVCTHLGCTPAFRPNPGDPTVGVANWPGGFYCPCHGSRFDLAGRVFKDVPAPINLEVPAYVYLPGNVVRIGEET